MERAMLNKLVISLLVAFLCAIAVTQQTPAQTVEIPTSSSDPGDLVQLRTKVEILSNRLKDRTIGASDIIGLAAVAELVTSELLDENALKEVTSVADLAKKARVTSPVVLRQFCIDLGLPSNSCQELDPKGHTQLAARRLCPYDFDAQQPMPIDQPALDAWIARRLQPLSGKTKWATNQSLYKKNGATAIPIRQDAILTRTFFDTTNALLAADWTKLQSAIPDKLLLMERIKDVVITRLNNAHVLINFRQTMQDALQDPVISPLIFNQSLKSEITDVLTSFDKLTHSDELYTVAVALGTNDVLSHKSRQLITKLYGQLDVRRSELNSKISEIRNQIKQNQAVTEGACGAPPETSSIKISGGTTAGIYAIPDDGDPVNGNFQAQLALGIKDVQVKASTKEKALTNNEFCSALRFLHLGIHIPMRSKQVGSQRIITMVQTEGNLTIDINESQLLTTLRTIAPIPSYITFSGPRVQISDSSLTNVAIELTERVQIADASYFRRITLIKDGLVDLAQLAKELVDLTDARIAVDRALSNKGRTVALSPYISAVELRTDGEWKIGNSTDIKAGPRLSGAVEIFVKQSSGAGLTRLVRGRAQFSLLTGSDGQWHLQPLGALANEWTSDLESALPKQEILKNAVAHIPALTASADSAADILEGRVSLGNYRIADSTLVIDVTLNLANGPILIGNLAVDLSKGELANQISTNVGEALKNSYANVLIDFIRARQASLVNVADQEFANLITKLNNSSFEIVGLRATPIVSPAKPYLTAIQIHLPGQSDVTISGLTLAGFSDSESNPPVPRFVARMLQIASGDQRRLEEALTKQLTGSINLPWLGKTSTSVSLEGGMLSLSAAGELPLIGDFRFPIIQVDFQDGQFRRPLGQIGDVLKQSIADRLSKEISYQVSAWLPEDIRGIIGQIQVRLDGQVFTAVAPFKFSVVTGRAIVTLTIQGGTFRPSVRLEYDDLNYASLLQSSVINFLGGGAVTVSAKEPDRPELRVSIDGIPLGSGLFNISVTNVGFTPRGLEIDGISITIPAALPIPPFIVIMRPRIGVMFKSKGFLVGGDITFEGTGDVFKIEGDIRGYFEQLRVDLLGRMVLLDFLPLFENKGTVNFKEQLIQTSSRTVGVLRIIFPVDDTSTLDAKAGTVDEASSVSLLAIKMNTQAHISVKDQRITIHGDVSLPILPDAKLSGYFKSNIFLSDPELELDGNVSLVGIGTSLKINADSGYAKLIMKVLGISVTVIAPGPGSFSTGFLERIVRDLLRPSFDLSHLKKLDVVINLLPRGSDPERPKPSGGSPDQPTRAGGNVSSGGNPAPGSPENDKLKAPQPPPPQSFAIIPFDGVDTGWTQGYTLYKPTLPYYCYASWQIGSKDKPVCERDVISKEIKSALEQVGARWLFDSRASIAIPSCILGTECGASELSPTSHLEVWIDPAGKLFSFVSSHQGKPVPMIISTELANVFGEDPVRIIKRRKEKGQSYQAIMYLLELEAQRAVLNGMSAGVKASELWSSVEGRKVWAISATTQDIDIGKDTQLFILVDIEADQIVTFQATSPFAVFLKHLLDPGSAQGHPLRTAFANDLVSESISILWGDDGHALIVKQQDEVHYADLKLLGAGIAFDTRSLAREFYPSEKTSFNKVGLLSAVTSFLSTDREWNEMRLDEPKHAAVLGNNLQASNWRLALILWDEAQVANGRISIIRGTDLTSRLPCWKRKGWIDGQAGEKLQVASGAGRFLADSVMMSAPEYVSAGFLVNPRRLLDQCQ
jgi:hypothetical protein